MKRWILFSVLAGLLALWLSHSIMLAPFVTNDGIQYIDAAEHLRAHDCLCTTVAHFDEQMAHGRFPVPFTHFAPGYPILIASLSSAGISTPIAGYLISAASFIVTLYLMLYIGLQLGVRPFALLLVSLLWLTNALVLATASAILADLPLTAIFCTTVALVIKDIQDKRAGRFRLVCVGIASAAAYWTKYAGVFVIPIAILYLLWRAWRTPKSRSWAVGGIAAALLLAAPLPIHNILYEGSWRGGFHNSKHSGMRFAITESIKAIYHLVFGAGVRAHLDFWAVIAILSLIGGVILTFRRQRSARAPIALIWMVLLAAAFTSGIALAAAQSIATDLLRYNMPIYPLILVGGVAFFMPKDRVELIVFSLLIAAILSIQSRSLLPLSISRPDRVQMVLNQLLEPGVSMRQWLESHVSPKDAILAVDGQALHYVLKRPVVSIIEPIFSDRNTDESAFMFLMAQFHARYIVVYPDWPADLVPEQHAVPFLRDLASGVAPSWLRLAAHTGNVAVFECLKCVSTRSAGV